MLYISYSITFELLVNWIVIYLEYRRSLGIQRAFTSSLKRAYWNSWFVRLNIKSIYTKWLVANKSFLFPSCGSVNLNYWWNSVLILMMKFDISNFEIQICAYSYVMSIASLPISPPPLDTVRPEKRVFVLFEWLACFELRERNQLARHQLGCVLFCQFLLFCYYISLV